MSILLFLALILSVGYCVYLRISMPTRLSRKDTSA